MLDHRDGHGQDGATDGTGQAASVAAQGLAAVTDPICGITVDPAMSKHLFEHAGTAYHFCSAGCRSKFEADPAKYLAPQPAIAQPKPAAAPAKPGAIYTCPMHPQIRQAGPGSCPICGMAPEPAVVTAEAPPNRKLADMTRRFWIGLVFALPVFVLEMGSHVPALGLERLVPMQASIWIQFVLSTPVVLWAGWPFFQRAWASLVTRHLNMFTLIALGTGAAYLYSLAATFAPDLFPAGFRGMGGTVAVYYEAAAVITVLVLLGQVLELRARGQTGGAIRALLNLAPKLSPRGDRRRVGQQGHDMVPHDWLDIFGVDVAAGVVCGAGFACIHVSGLLRGDEAAGQGGTRVLRFHTEEWHQAQSDCMEHPKPRGQTVPPSAPSVASFGTSRAAGKAL